MGTYRDSEHYDDPKVWMRTTSYANEDPPYCPPWPPRHWWTVRFNYMKNHIADDTPILDLGCGNGLFSAFIWSKGHRANYLGYDFSVGSIEKAIEGNRKSGHQNARFEQRSILEVDILEELNTLRGGGPDPMLVCAETLEHLEDDLLLIKKIPSGASVLFTIPTFDESAHVRWFPRKKDVIERYGSFFVDPFIERIRAPWRKYTRQCFLITGEWK